MQLDFSSLLQPQAILLAFPPKYLCAHVEAAAKRIVASDRSQKYSLLQEVGRMEIRYLQMGFSVFDAAKLADDYEQAVLAKVCEMRASPRRQDPKGAA